MDENKKKKIAIVTSHKWYRCCREDLYIEEHLHMAGYLPEIVVWTDPIPWKSYDLVIIRSVWDYYQHYSDFCAWLNNLKANGVPVANKVDCILQNINKPAQINHFSSCSTPFIKTLLCDNTLKLCEAIESINQQYVVIKPSISASGHNTFLVDKKSENWKHRLLIDGNQILKEADLIIVQPYMSAVEDGEISLVYFQNEFSHAVKRFPGVFTQRRSVIPLKTVPSDYVVSGQKVIDHLSLTDLLYCRIDMIKQNSQIYVMEVETADPDLFLSLKYPEQEPPIQHFIDAIQCYF